MRLPLLLLLTFLCTRVPAQKALIAQLATEVCNCLNEVEDVPETVAPECLRRVAALNYQSVREELDLDAALPGHRLRIAELITEDLLDRCPRLTTLSDEAGEAQTVWTDADQLPAPSRKIFGGPKGYTLAVPELINGEAPPEIQATGSVVTGPDDNVLQLVDYRGRRRSFELPQALLRKTDFRTGDELTVVYRREWRKEERKVVRVVVRVEGNR